MVTYTTGFYRYTESFDDSTMRRTLEALHGLSMGFFPASMWVSNEDKVLFREPSEYERSLVPAAYYISAGVARIPLDCANGVALSITESDNPQNVPANLVARFGAATLAANAWQLPQLLALFRAVVGCFEADCAVLYDEAHGGRPAYDERLFDFDMRRVPLGLFWINYYGPEWARNVGMDRLERLRSAVPAFEWLENGGVLFAIQEAPYDERIASHRENQERLEELMGLRQLQARFPNPGL